MNPIQMTHGVGRAKNAIQDYLIHKLLFPKVYLDAVFNGKNVDVLAIDHAGTGDIHAVYIVYTGADSESALETVLSNLVGVPPSPVIPHFVYSAVVNDGSGTNQFIPSNRILLQLLAEDGVGRVGILYVDLTLDDPAVRIIVKAERFRSSREIVEQADQFVASHTPNWEMRE